MIMIKIYRDEIGDIEKLSFSEYAEKLVLTHFEKRGAQPKVIQRTLRQTPDLVLIWEGCPILCEVKVVQSSRRGIDTSDTFDRDFRKPVLDHFKRKSLQKLPFYVVIDNDRMESPTKEESKAFAAELENALIQLKIGSVPSGWERVQYPPNIQPNSAFFLWRYRIMESRKDAKERLFQIRVSYNDKLIIDIPTYGGLNCRPIAQDISNADDQLREYANSQNIPDALRLVAFLIKDGLDFHILSFVRTVRHALSSHIEIGGVVFFQWALEGSEFTSRQFLRPTLLHNDWSPPNHSIPDGLFDDGVSSQIHDLDQCIRTLSSARLFT
jgi:hypothetical protein